MTVTIIGTIALDSIKTPDENRERILGGTATFSGIAANLFADVNVVSVVGHDFPDRHLNLLRAKNVNVDGLVISKSHKTFHWQGFYEKDMGEAFTTDTQLNVLVEFDPVIPDHAKSSTVVFLANFDPELQLRALNQFHEPKHVILDSMNFWIENKSEELKDVLKQVDIFIINDQEIRQFTGRDNLIQAAHDVFDLGVKRIIVKKGEHGSIMFNGQDYFVCPAVPIKNLVDPTGAGDSFAGGFAGYLAKHIRDNDITEETYKTAMILGTIISSYTVQGFSIEKLETLNEMLIKEKYLELQSISKFPDFA